MYEKMQKFGLIEIIHLICISALWGTYPVLSHPASPRGAPLGVPAVVDCLMAGICFHPESPQGSPSGAMA